MLSSLKYEITIHSYMKPFEGYQYSQNIATTMDPS